VVDTYVYSAYGVPGPTTGSDYNPFRYGGQYGYYTDPGGSNGLILCGARWYSPTLGRWLSRDPIDYAGGDNLYSYCDSNPIGEIDPDGFAAIRPNLGGELGGGSDDGRDLLDHCSDFFGGWGDNLSWGATGIIRRWLGVDDVVDHNSGYYSAGEWIGTIHSTLIGGAKGWAKDWEMLGSKAVPHAAFPRGLMYVEESHVIPARFKWVPDFIRNSKFNIKPLWGIDHAMSDAKRFNFLRKSFKDTVV